MAGCGGQEVQGSEQRREEQRREQQRMEEGAEEEEIEERAGQERTAGSRWWREQGDMKGQQSAWRADWRYVESKKRGPAGKSG